MQGADLTVLDVARDLRMCLNRGGIELRAQNIFDGVALERTANAA